MIVTGLANFRTRIRRSQLVVEGPTPSDARSVRPVRVRACPTRKFILTVPQSKNAMPAIPAIDGPDDHSYFGAFRKRRTIAIGAATLAFLTVTVHDLPAQAATMKEEAYAAASQTMVVSTATFAPSARSRRQVRHHPVHPGAVADRPVERRQQRIRLARRAVSLGLLVRSPGRRLRPRRTAPRSTSSPTASSSSPPADGGLGQHVVVAARDQRRHGADRLRPHDLRLADRERRRHRHDGPGHRRRRQHRRQHRPAPALRGPRRAAARPSSRSAGCATNVTEKWVS